MSFNLTTTRFEDFKKLACWNLNFHCFEGRDNTTGAYKAGREDAYCVLVELLEESPSIKKFHSEEKRNKLYFGSEKTFLELFNFNTRMNKSINGKRIDLSEAYWRAVEEVYTICKALYHYSHPRLTNQMKFKNLNTQQVYQVNISEEKVLVTTGEGIIFKEFSKDKKDFIFLEEVVGLEEALLSPFEII